MELTLKRVLEHAEFPKYRGKGYDPAAVDDFLDKAAAMAAKVEVQLTQALEAAQAGGGPSQEDIQAEVERRVNQRLAEEAENRPAGASEEEAAEEVRRTIIMAQRTADAAVREAREDAEKIVGSAKDQAETMVADAEARAEALRTEAEAHAASTREETEAEATRERREARQRLAAEIAELEAIRETLRTDVTVLERHVSEQRTQLSSTLDELRTLLEDPTGFRVAPSPALQDPALPDFSDLDETEPATEDGLAAPAAAPEPEAASDAATEADSPPEPEIPAGAAPDAGAHAEIDQPGPDPEAVAEPEATVDAPPAPEADSIPAPQEAPVEEPADEAPPASPAAEAEPAGGDDAGSSPEAATAPEAAPSEPDPPADDPPPGPPTASAQPLAFGDVDHDAPGLVDPGPPTQPVSAVDPAAGPPSDDEDPFLTELRKAMADDEPLGPRDDVDLPPSPNLFGDDEGDRRRRFGRRR